MKKKEKYIITTLIILFLTIMFLVIFDKTKQFDTSIYEIVTSIKNKYIDNFFIYITKLGNVSTITLIFIILFIITNKNDKIFLSLLTAIDLITNTLIKYIIKRPRPSVEHLIVQGGYSFPSGHAMISVMIYGFLIYLINKKIKNTPLKITLTSLMLFLIIAISISRIYVGVHYASDVIAGLLLSSIEMIFIIDFQKKYIKENKKSGKNE